MKILKRTLEKECQASLITPLTTEYSSQPVQKEHFFMRDRLRETEIRPTVLHKKKAEEFFQCDKVLEFGAGWSRGIREQAVLFTEHFITEPHHI